MIESLNSCCIIPARKGSKRLPGKNIRLLADKPLIAWTIETAVRSMCFDRIIVSTDCKEIAKISIEAGALVPFLRPKDLAQDDTSTVEVIKHCLNLETTAGFGYNLVTVLQPTSPLRNELDIKSAFSLFKEKRAHSVVSVSPTDHPPEWTNKLPPDLNMEGFISQEALDQRSQDLPKSYTLNGAIYIYRTSIFLSKDSMIFNDLMSFAYVMPANRSLDIDTIEDFELAEIRLRHQMAQKI